MLSVPPFFFYNAKSMARENPQLGRLLYGALRGGTAVVLATVDEDGAPSTALNTWIVARDEGTIALAVDARSNAYANISAGRCKVAFEVLADDLVLGVRGKATIVKERLLEVSFPCALAHIAVESIRDHTASGVRFRGPQYSYMGDKGHRSDVEQAIFEVLARDVSDSSKR